MKRAWLAFIPVILFICTPLIAGADQVTIPSNSGSQGIFGEGTTGWADPVTGAARTSYTFELPAARGLSQPRLALTYNSASSQVRDAGISWGLNLPTIEMERYGGGPPGYFPLDFYPDRILYNGAPLVLVSNGNAESVQMVHGETEQIPSWARGSIGIPPGGIGYRAGWRYYRLQEDRESDRFFWSPDHKTWKILKKSGETYELGHPLTYPDQDDAIEEDVYKVIDHGALRTFRSMFRWRLVRQYDHRCDPNPCNIAIYHWHKLGKLGLAYLTDVYDTPPAGATPPYALGSFAHHVHLAYEPNDFPYRADYSIAPIWKVRPDLHISRVDVAGNGHDSTKSRTIIRRYTLHYGTKQRLSSTFLGQIEVEGSCGATETPIPSPTAGESSDYEAPPQSNCPHLPSTDFSYTNAPDEQYQLSLATLSSENPPPSTPNFPWPVTAAFVDVNRDGATDIVESRPTSASEESRIYISQANVSGTSRNTVLAYNKVTDTQTETDTNLFSANSGFTITGPPELTNRASIYKRPNNAIVGLRKWYLKSAGPQAWQWHRGGDLDQGADRIFVAGDVDGNGVVDGMYFTDTGTPTNFTAISYVPRFAPRIDRKYPYYDVNEIMTLGLGQPASSISGITNIRYDKNVPFYAMADMNGDGTVDLVTLSPIAEDPKHRPFIYYPGNGRGIFGCEPKMGICTVPPPCASPQDPNIGCDVPWVELQSSPTYSLDGGSNDFLFTDFNNDGFSDIVEAKSKVVEQKVEMDLYIHLNLGKSIYNTLNFFDLTFGFTDTVRLGAGDLRGTGINSLMLLGKGYLSAIDLYNELPNGAPGLLARIYDGRFSTSTTFSYRSVFELDEEARKSGAPWSYHSPQAMHVVTSITHKQGEPGTSRFEESTTTFQYRDPAYDSWDARLQGFREVTSTTDGREKVRTKYYFSHCYEGGIETCGGVGDMDTWRSVNGSPYQIDVLGAETGAVSRTTTMRHKVRILYEAKDQEGENRYVLPRKVAFAYPEQVDTYYYDTAPFVPRASTITAPVVTTDVGLQMIDAEYQLASDRRAQIRRTEDRDAFGNIRRVVDFGRIDGPEPDLPIVATYVIVPDPNPDLYGFRLTNETVPGFENRAGIPTDYGATRRMVYNAAGDVSDIFGTLTGTLPLVRRHEHGETIAPPPSMASVDGEALLAHFDYDAFGNVTSRHGPQQTGCAGLDYDTDYRHLLASTARYVSGCAGAAFKDVTISFGNPFDLPTKVSRSDHSVVMTTYDELGRVKTTTDPDPDVVGLPSRDSTLVNYFFSNPENSQGFSVQSPVADGETVTAWSYGDAFGQKIASMIQSTDEGAQWIVSGAASYRRGRVVRTFRPYPSPNEPATGHFAYPASPDAQFSYDEFGRIWEATDRGRRTRREYHELSVDVYDEEDLRQGQFPVTYKSIIYDGHGRVKAVIARNRRGASGGVDLIRTTYSYDSAGRVVSTVKSHSAGSETIRRWTQHDSFGRVVLNAEPNASKNFVADPQDPAAFTTMRAWRYAYDDTGRLVGTSDARGCGKNLAYDGLGRLLTEDYSPCLSHHELYTPIDAAKGTGAESVYQYDAAGLLDSPGYRGRLTAIADRGAITHFGYDGRGRVRETARRLTRPASVGPAPDLDSGGLDAELGIHIDIGGGDAGSEVSSDRYTPHLFRKTVAYDLANRVTSESTGADVPELLAANGTSLVQYSYYKRGLLKAVSSSYGPLIESIHYNVDGTPSLTTYGDGAGTTIDMQYDSHELTGLKVSRTKPALWSKETDYYTPADPLAVSSLQTELTNLEFAYDGVGNPKRITDKRNPDEWPAGAKPRTQVLEYDDLYRLVSERVAYSTSSKTDPQVSPFAAEQGDPRWRVVPRLIREKRSTGFNISYDFSGNTTSIADLDSTVFDRTALGAVTNGDSEGHPNRLTVSSLGVQLVYDDTGNVVDMLVPRTGECNQALGKCSHHFMYDWDEVGQLVRARRWDYDEIPSDEPRYPEVPFFTPNVDVRYAYSQGQRVLKSVKGNGLLERHSAEIFSSLRLERALWHSDEYDVSEATENAYLGGIGRVVVSEDDLPAMSSSKRHVFLTIGDKLGSTNVVLDRDTGELVENVQYHPYGSVDSDYRPERWGSQREVYQFTGKESDIEVGLTYFGARYYSPGLGRWMSADPLTVHAGGGDMNPYAYVSGAVLRLTDPTGLCGLDGRDVPCYPNNPEPDPDSPPPGAGPRGGGRAGCNDPGGCGISESGVRGAPRPPPQVGPARGSYSSGEIRETRKPQPYMMGSNPAYGKDSWSKNVSMTLSQLYAQKYGGATAARIYGADFFDHVATEVAKQVAIFVLTDGTAQLLSLGAREAVLLDTLAARGAGTGLKALKTQVNPCGFANNCGSVAIAFDRMMAGAPTTAVNSGPMFASEVAAVYGKGGFSSYPSLNSISEFIGRAGPGARGIVHGGKASGEMGHFFNVVNQDGQVVFIDASTGAFADPSVYDYFEMVRTN